MKVLLPRPGGAGDADADGLARVRQQSREQVLPPSVDGGGLLDSISVNVRASRAMLPERTPA